MRASSSNFTRSNRRGAENPDPPVALGKDAPSRTTSRSRRERFLSCLTDHPALPMFVRLVLTVSTWFPDDTSGLCEWTTNWQSRFVALILTHLPEEVLNESYRRMVRRTLIDRLRRR